MASLLVVFKGQLIEVQPLTLSHLQLPGYLEGAARHYAEMYGDADTNDHDLEIIVVRTAAEDSAFQSLRQKKVKLTVN